MWKSFILTMLYVIVMNIILWSVEGYFGIHVPSMVFFILAVIIGYNNDKISNFLGIKY